MSTLHDLREGDVRVCPSLPIQLNRLDIIVLRHIALRLDHELLSCIITIAQLDRHLIEERTGDAHRGIGSRQALDVEQSQGSHHIPSTQLTLVLVLSVAVAMDTIRPVELIKDGTNPVLRQ